MALLIVDLDKRIGNAKAWRDTFAEKIPDLEIRIWPDPGELADIEYLAFMHPDFDALPVFPNLKAMFSRSAGVEAFVGPSQIAKGPARQNGAAGRRSDDDRIRRHARAALSS
jgi:glyoxylate/hydroxypyruvate reductase A